MLESRLQTELESAELERVGMERCDRPGSDAEFDAHTLGYSELWVGCTRAFDAKEIEMPSKVQKSAMGGREKIVGEQADALRLASMDLMASLVDLDDSHGSTRRY